MNVPRGFLSSFDDSHWTTLTWTSQNRDKSVTFQVESAYVLDGIPYVRLPDADITQMDDLPVPDATVVSFFSGTRVCESNWYWNNISIDPFVGLFSVESNTPAAKRTAVYVIVLPVVFGVVLLLAVGLIIAAIVSPAVRVFFRPFSRKRDNRKGNVESQAGERASGWTKSAKPANL